MKNKYFIKKPIYLIILTIIISLALFILLYGIVNLEKKIEKKMLKISTVDVLSITKNSADSIEKILKDKNYIEEIQNNKQIHREIEKTLELLITSNIKYAYLLYKDEKGIFRFLADGAKKNEKAFINQKFDIESSKWLEIFKLKKPLNLEHQYLHELSISYLFPILDSSNEVKLILAIDFSVERIEDIQNIISLMKTVIISITIITIIFLLILIIQSYRFLAIKKTAYIDNLTNVYNRNYMYELDNFINLNNYILAVIDIDYFKVVNDDFGHDIGDIVLKEVADMISFSTRDSEDIVIRYGGEEFIVFAKIKRNDSVPPLKVIERILENIRNHKFFYTKDDYIKLTVSIGVNLLPNESKTLLDAFKLADIALYNAKNAGRNNIQICDNLA
ncbi:MAG: GGDEF domain-containing protein [Arcobacter sp.]|nr:MAG: GGDEF domain-containing protein [Arcobacter sp.]